MTIRNFVDNFLYVRDSIIYNLEERPENTINTTLLTKCSKGFESRRGFSLTSKDGTKIEPWAILDGTLKPVHSWLQNDQSLSNFLTDEVQFFVIRGYDWVD